MNTSIDPWMITPHEKEKFKEQFKALKPQNDHVTGLQARDFFLKSNLPPHVLGEIWALADTDADGKMNINEFSIACKLINLKLRSFDIPKVLPPNILASLASADRVPLMTPTSISPIDTIKSNAGPTINNSIPPARPPVLPQAMMAPTINKSAPPAVIPIMPSAMNQSLISTANTNTMRSVTEALIPDVQSIQPLPNIPLVQPMSSMLPIATTQPNASIQPLIPAASLSYAHQPIEIMQSTEKRMSIDLLGNQLNSPVDVVPPLTNMPGPPTPPHTEKPKRSMSISDKIPSIDSPNSAISQIEWAIKNQIKLKYTQLFNTTDRTRSGFLTGAQARNIMVQTKLPQSTLAQIWALADMDSDGRLGCDEFVLAMYLCDLATQGEVIPTKLSIELIPPSFRKVQSRHGSVNGSRQGSLSAQGAPIIDTEMASRLPGQTSFEDKRKENFDKGQAELERRRKVLLDVQRKEQEERDRKERDEAEKKEKARLEADRRQQEELERQLQTQKQLELEKEEKRKRDLEQKETARKEMEKQRQLEWEKQRISDMQLQQQREQEKVLKLKAQSQQYSIELSTLNEKIKELSQRICDTRAGVSNVKTLIDGMRSTRDAQISEMAQLKLQIKDQNQKLVHLSQEKAKLDSKTKQGVDNQDLAYSNKQIIINQLLQKVEDSKKDVDTKQIDINQNNSQLDDLKRDIIELLNDCETLYSDYDVQRCKVLEMKANNKFESLSSQWDNEPAWGTSKFDQEEPKVASNVEASDDIYWRYHAIYEFSARNSDEISFKPGDIILVPKVQNAEPGWLAGEIDGHTGWFPETYVEKMDNGSNGTEFVENTATPVSTDKFDEYGELSKIPENTDVQISETTTDTITHNGEVEEYIACYPYESNEIGDLVFSAGERISVFKKEGDWWTGSIGTRIGIFPSNYVQPVSEATTFTDNHNTPERNGSFEPLEANGKQQPISEEAKRQEEADSEVSEIITQSKSDYVQDVYNRPMSTSTTPGLKKPKGEVAQVIAAYEATSTEQLSLQRGQLIMIRKKTESGWWEGELQARGRRRQIGWFPATYVKVLQSGRLSGRSTPVSGGKIQMNETIIDKVIAMYPYKAQNDDELSFEKDDIISVLGKDEPEWWRGECQGLTGLFPSNYVGPFVTSGNV